MSPAGWPELGNYYFKSKVTGSRNTSLQNLSNLLCTLNFFNTIKCLLSIEFKYVASQPSCGECVSRLKESEVVLKY